MRLGAPSPPPSPPATPPAPPPPPALPPPSLPSCPLGDVCTTGLCSITDGGSCATSPQFPNNYPIDEGCTIYSVPPVGLDVIFFDVDTFDPGVSSAAPNCPWDYLVVNGVKYCGTSGPAGVVPSDGTMTWVSDSGVTESGWKARAPPSVSLAPHTLPLLCSRAHPAPVPNPLCLPPLPPIFRCAGLRSRRRRGRHPNLPRLARARLARASRAPDFGRLALALARSALGLGTATVPPPRLPLRAMPAPRAIRARATPSATLTTATATPARRALIAQAPDSRATRAACPMPARATATARAWRPRRPRRTCRQWWCHCRA